MRSRGECSPMRDGNLGWRPSPRPTEIAIDRTSWAAGNPLRARAGCPRDHLGRFADAARSPQPSQWSSLALIDLPARELPSRPEREAESHESERDRRNTRLVGEHGERWKWLALQS